MGAETTLTAQFANQIHRFRFEALPLAVQVCATATTLDTLGAMLSASAPTYPIGAKLRSLWGGGAVDGDGTNRATLVGLQARATPIDAALVNGTLAYYCDIETLHPGAIMHAAAVALPAALAIAETRPCSGAEFLAALTLGVEIGCRASHAIGPNALYARGFHPSAVAGAFGAAAAAGWLLKLSPAQIEIALGLAATQSGGLLAWASDHTEESRPFNCGLAARNGVTAALMAEAGFGGPLGVFDPASKYNAYQAWSTAPNPDALFDDWRRRFYLTEAAFKRYACCGFLHPALDAIAALQADGRVSAGNAAAITLRFAPSGRAMIDANPLRSHCAQYILPVGLVRGQVQLDDLLTDRCAEDPLIADLARHTRVVPDDQLEPLYPERYASIVEVTCRGGRIAHQRVDTPRGYPSNPLTPAELVRKFMELASPAIGVNRAEWLRAEVAALADRPDLGRLVELLG